jgi:hypothetical protein
MKTNKNKQQHRLNHHKLNKNNQKKNIDNNILNNNIINKTSIELHKYYREIENPFNNLIVMNNSISKKI